MKNEKYCGKCGENVVYLSVMVSIVNTFADRKNSNRRSVDCRRTMMMRRNNMRQPATLRDAI